MTQSNMSEYTFKYNKCLSKEEILELYFSFVYNDPKDKLNKFINEFGSVKKLFEADIDRLLKLNYVKLREAVFIKMVYEIKKACIAEKDSECKTYKDKKSICNIIKNKFYNLEKERVALILFNKNMKMLNFGFISEGGFNSVNIYLRDIIHKISKYGAKYAVIAHNHPSGNCLPSKEDILSTKKIYRALNTIDIELLDHYIVGRNCIESLSDAGLLICEV